MSPHSLMVRAAYACSRMRPHFNSAAYDSLVAEFMPPITAAAQGIKQAGKCRRVWRTCCLTCNMCTGAELIKQTTLLAEVFAEQRRMVCSVTFQSPMACSCLQS
jgi:hypothetical protein